MVAGWQLTAAAMELLSIPEADLKHGSYGSYLVGMHAWTWILERAIQANSNGSSV